MLPILDVSYISKVHQSPRPLQSLWFYASEDESFVPFELRFALRFAPRRLAAALGRAGLGRPRPAALCGKLRPGGGSLTGSARGSKRGGKQRTKGLCDYEDL